MQEKEQGDRDESEREQAEMEAREGQKRAEEYSKRDRLLSRLMGAETPQDVAAATEMIADYENPHMGESIDRYTFNAFKRAAIEGQRAYEKGAKKLTDRQAEAFATDLTNELKAAAKKAGISENLSVNKDGIFTVDGDEGARYDLNVMHGLRKTGIVTKDAIVNDKGDLIRGKVRASGYAISVRKGDKDEGERSEVVHFGTRIEREAMAKAHEALHHQLVTGEELQNQVITFDKARAALEQMVEQFYKYQIYFTNKQTKWFFSEPDVAKIDATMPETLNNKEVGDRRNRAMRMYYLVGMCETREKMESHLNGTQNLERILDKKTIETVLGIAKENHSELLDITKGGIDPKTDEEKFDVAAKFLIGKNLVIDRSRKDGQLQYSLPKWKTAEERDPLGMAEPSVRGDPRTEFRYEQKVKERGAGTVGVEAKEGVEVGNPYGQRGYLTEVGNPYAEDSRDNLFMLMERMSVITGDELAVTDAGRYFYTRGMRDELGLELYTKEENFPTGEKLLEYVNTHTDAERKIYFKGLQRLITLNGEPAGSDLSKIIHTKWWRFKEMIRDRSAGPLLTYDKFDHMTLSLLSLCRTDVSITGYKEKLDSEGKVVYEHGKPAFEPVPVTEKQQRSLKEQWLGFKSPDYRPNEEAKDLGDLDWEKVKIPDDVKSAVDLSGVGVRDNADGYFWVMNYLSSESGSPASQDKRPYQFIMKGPQRFSDMMNPEGYTDKIKFWNITRHDAVAIGGGWRDLYAQYNGETKFAEYMAGVKAAEDVGKGQKDWYFGVRSMPGYFGEGDRDVDYSDQKGVRRSSKTFSLVEQMAIKFGFLDQEEKDRSISYMKRMTVFKY